MKEIYLLAVLSVVILAVAAFYDDEECNDRPIPERCPEVDPINTTIHLAHENCEKFYMCLRGERIEMICPWMDKAHTKRLHFNPRCQVCDWPDRARCNDSHIPVIPCPNDTGNLTYKIADRKYCDWFIMCTNGKEEPSRCLLPEVFNIWDEYHGNCSANVGQCGTRITTPGNFAPIVRDTTAKYDVCLTEKEGKKLRHESSCSSYYVCTNGQKILRHCRAGLHFNYDLQMCDYPQKECEI